MRSTFSATSSTWQTWSFRRRYSERVSLMGSHVDARSLEAIQSVWVAILERDRLDRYRQPLRRRRGAALVLGMLEGRCPARRQPGTGMRLLRMAAAERYCAYYCRRGTEQLIHGAGGLASLQRTRPSSSAASRFFPLRHWHRSSMRAWMPSKPGSGFPGGCRPARDYLAVAQDLERLVSRRI